MDNLDTFGAVLYPYAEFFHCSNVATTPAYVSQIDNPATTEVVREFDKKISVEEDPTIWEYGHEKDPVAIEVPEAQAVDDEHPLQFFTRAIPPDLDQQICCRCKVGAARSNFTWYPLTSHELVVPSPTRPVNDQLTLDCCQSGIKLLLQPLDVFTAPSRYCEETQIILAVSTGAFPELPQPQKGEDWLHEILSPPSAMLAREGEVDAKLRKMNKTFLASLEGLGGIKRCMAPRVVGGRVQLDLEWGNLCTQGTGSAAT
ncbi:hypothetical protein EV421DRAFT_2019266 [Armillaria borealis]|uniref:Uncharacterized protein n=1 Tax=Armillaria borealis TaxID=47425 RepID=A0AA39JJ17_9AGAR|nr:hypothetical protein EV421DRAFT_2019266 [Armillaria borealis]